MLTQVPSPVSLSTTASANSFTCTGTFTVCDGRGVIPSPLLPVPSDSRMRPIVPFLTPTPLVSMLTTILVLLEPSGRRAQVMEPAAIAPPVAVPKLAVEFGESVNSARVFGSR